MLKQRRTSSARSCGRAVAAAREVVETASGKVTAWDGVKRKLTIEANR